VTMTINYSSNMFFIFLTADIHGEFLLHASPKNRDIKKDGYTPARVGEDFQAEVASVQEFEQQRQGATTESGRSMVTRGSSVGSSLYWGASALSASLKTNAEAEPSMEEVISSYLSLAWVVVNRLKAEKLSDYYQAQRESLIPRAEPKAPGTEAMTVEGEPESAPTANEKSSTPVLKDVDVIDKSFVTINKEVEELLLSNFFSRYFSLPML